MNRLAILWALCVCLFTAFFFFGSGADAAPSNASRFVISLLLGGSLSSVIFVTIGGALFFFRRPKS